MSRIGKKPITIPKGVTVDIKEGELQFKGAKGTLKTPVPAGITRRTTFRACRSGLMASRSRTLVKSPLKQRRFASAKRIARGC